ncbi:VHS1002 protein [Vibrio phage 1]|nr:VHS1002 protein [Vibrio phage 1]
MTGVKRAAPEVQRKALDLVQHFVQTGIAFVPVAICDDEEELIERLRANLEKLEKKAND